MKAPSFCDLPESKKQEQIKTPGPQIPSLVFLAQSPTTSHTAHAVNFMGPICQGVCFPNLQGRGTSGPSTGTQCDAYFCLFNHLELQRHRCQKGSGEQREEPFTTEAARPGCSALGRRVPPARHDDRSSGAKGILSFQVVG